VRLGVFSDVHGNRLALDAVLADGEREGVDQWWALGDHVAVGPEPEATLERLASVPGLTAIRGNTDRYTVTNDRPFPRAEDVAADPSLLELFAAVQRSFAWTRGALEGTGGLEWLHGLASSASATLDDGTRLLGVHASPASDDDDGITPHRDEAALVVDLDGVDADVVVGGHTHQPTDRMIGAIRVLNGGSVGNPITDDVRASYLVIDGAQVRLRRVPYDVDEFIARVRRSSHPEAAYIESFVTGAQVRHPARRPGAPTPEG
jgi:predicted phosphodiesterase